MPVCAQLLDAAAEAGEIRPDVDAYELMRGVGNLCIGADSDPRYDARRMVELLIAGLRHTARAPGRDSLLIMADWELRPASAADVEAVAELRAVVLRADLERLGRYDEHRVRQRLRDGFDPAHTWVIEVAGAFAGCVALRPAEDAHWLEHFYLAPRPAGQRHRHGRAARAAGAVRPRRHAGPAERAAGQPGPAAVRAARVHASRPRTRWTCSWCARPGRSPSRFGRRQCSVDR